MSFWEVAASVLPGVGSAIGGLAQAGAQRDANSANVAMARETNEFNAAQAGVTRDFQERMSNSAYQRATEDMTKAGLNPMLAFSQGGASSPSGASASGVQGRVDPVDAVGKGIARTASSALEGAAMVKGLEQAEANTQLAQESAMTQKTQQVLNSTNSQASFEKSKAQAMENDITREGVLDRAKSEKERAKLEREFVKFDAMNKRIQSGLDTAGKAVDTVIPIRKLRNVLGGSTAKSQRDYGRNGDLSREELHRQLRNRYYDDNP